MASSIAACSMVELKYDAIIDTKTCKFKGNLLREIADKMYTNKIIISWNIFKLMQILRVMRFRKEKI